LQNHTYDTFHKLAKCNVKLKLENTKAKSFIYSLFTPRHRQD